MGRQGVQVRTPACKPFWGWGLGEGPRTKPGETTRKDKEARLSRKQSDDLALWPAGGAETETLEAALRLRGHHLEARRKADAGTQTAAPRA